MKKLLVVSFILVGLMVGHIGYAQVPPLAEQIKVNVQVLSQIKANIIEMRIICRKYGRNLYGDIILTVGQKDDLVARYQALKSETENLWQSLL